MPWEQIECHPSVKQMIQRAVERNQFSQTTLIYGPSGAGQKAVARAVAMTLVCPKVEGDFCGVCDVCKKILDQKFPDVFFMRPDGVNYRIPQIRQMQEYASYQPYQSQYRIFLIADAHRMNKESANCLLKILEEPLPHNMFVLHTDNVTGVLDTILSRSRKIRLAPLPKAVFLHHFENTLPLDEAQTLSRISGGLPEQALELHESGYFVYRDEILKMLKALKERETAVGMLADYLSAEKETITLKLSILLGLIRDGVVSVHQSAGAPYMHQDRASISQAIWNMAQPDGLLGCFDKTLDAIESRSRYHNMNIVLFDLAQSLRRAISAL